MDINYDMVDLGLPSGTLWAKCNLGAKTETESGLYFQWSETKGYTRAGIERGEKKFGHKNVSYYDKDNNTYLKYNPCFDKKVILDKYDDAVSKNMGLNYRMPTKEDFEELLTNTTNEWITNYEGSGVNGRKFTSKTDPTKYIFIPASGWATIDSMYGVGFYINIWSSSLNISNPNYAWYLLGNPSYCNITDSSRWYGFSLRAVSK